MQRKVLSMIHSIQHFQTKGIENLDKIFMNYSSDMTKIAEMVKGVKESVINLGLSMIAEELELYDEHLRKNKQARAEWYIERRDETTLLTSLGSVTYHKTLFKHKVTGKYEYLLDRVMGIEKHTRITEDAEAEILKEAVQTSYRKGGLAVSMTEDCVSKETVMNKIHALEFPKNKEKPEKKKEVEYLYLDADEDHISLQFREKKGDLISLGKNRKNNNAIAKLIYVYEGIEKEAPEGKRHKLINPYYFCRVCDGEENGKLWEEVYEWIENHYEVRKLKGIYLNGDGGSWMKGGKKRIHGMTYVLDGFHLKEAIRKLTNRVKDSREEVRKECYEAVRKKTKEDWKEIVKRLEGEIKDESILNRMRDTSEYILSNWSAAKLRLSHKSEIKGCSAEGHVSHILSSRMSSRPMGWSKKGMSKMAELRAYYYNGGDMLELVRYQKEKIWKEESCEEVIYSCEAMLRAERKRSRELGNKANMPIYSIPYPQVKKIANFKNHIYGL